MSKYTRADLRDYQVRAAQRLYDGKPVIDPATGLPDDLSFARDGTAIHIDMGLGKTIIGLTAIADWFANGVLREGIDTVLVVAPIKVAETVWRQEALQWAHTRHLTFSLIRGTEKQRAYALTAKTHVHLVNPELLPWLQKWLREDWSAYAVLIIDESSKFKDNKSKRFRVLTNYGTQKGLRDIQGNVVRTPDGVSIKVPPHRFKRSGILTGTPAPTSMLNLWSPFYIIDHGARLHKKFDTYQGRFFHKTQEVAPHVHKFEVNPEEDEARPDWQAREGAPERIHEIIADITVELNAADYGILPKVNPPFIHKIELPPAVRKQYDVLERDALLELAHDTVMAQNGGAKSMMCWQMCNGAVYYVDDFGRKHWSHLHDEKLDVLIDLIDTLNTNVMIPYWFKHDLERIQARFQKEHIAYINFTPKNSVRVVEEWNKGKWPVLLMHPQSSSHGLNLQFGGFTLIFFSMLWSQELYSQTIARLARSGQGHPVSIHHIIAERTTDVLQYDTLIARGSDQQRFRAALRKYQELRGLDLFAGDTPWIDPLYFQSGTPISTFSGLGL